MSCKQIDLYGPFRRTGIITEWGRASQATDGMCRQDMEAHMSETLNWKEHLRDNPVFGILEAAEIDELLGPELSGEQRFNDGEVILREGESGVSLYVIGRGNVRVDAHAPDGSAITLARLAEGDVFGEMGFFDRKPRSASVIVDDENDCVVRRIYGEPFHDFLLVHPRLEFKLTLILSDRLRRVTEGAINMQFRALAEKFELLNTKNEAQLETINNALKTTHALFDATDNRVKEMSERAESVVGSVRRNQEWFKYLLTAAGAVGALLGALGVNIYFDLNSISDHYTSKLEEIKADSKEVDDILKSLEVQREFTDDIMEHIAVQQILFIQISGTQSSDEDFHEKIQEIEKSFYVIINNASDNLFENVLARIVQTIPIDSIFRENISIIIEGNISNVAYKRRIILYYVLLVSLDMQGDVIKYNDALERFKGEIDNYNNIYSESVRDKFSKSISPKIIEDALFAPIYLDMYSEALSEDNKVILDDAERLAEEKELTRKAREYAGQKVENIRKAWAFLPR